MIIDEINGYLDINEPGMKKVKDELNEFKHIINDNKTIPVCILSHMYDPKRSKMLVELMDSDIDREYVIFTYEDQKELYEQFKSKVNVHYIPTDNPVYLTLSGKRQYILEWAQNNGHEDAFFSEDDCYSYYLPIGGIGGTGNFRNKKYPMTLGFMYSFWEFLIKKYSLTYSGPVNNMEFTFRNLDENPFIKHLAQVVQTVHINVQSCKTNNINFDHDAGWDDYDMIIQQCVHNKGTHGIIFSYVTPALKSGVSAMSSDADKLAKRCENNTNALINKWGLSLVREDTKKGLYNAKVNWNNIRKAYNNNVDLTKLIGMNHESAKKFIVSNNETQELGEW